MPKRLILCNCSETQTFDLKALSTLEGVTCSRVHSNLCEAEIETAAAQIGDGDAIIACTQERVLFGDLAEEIGAEPPLFVDLRDRAGWSDEAERAGPKMAALVADALLDAPMIKMVDVESQGRCLILGPAEVALPLAARLAEVLAVTVLLHEDEAEEAPMERSFDVVLGRLAGARGAFGGFDLRIDGLRQLQRSGRGAPAFGAPRDGAKSSCDILIDLGGGPALFPAPHKRDGYLRADPRDPHAVAEAAIEAAQMVGTFEKPLHMRIEPQLCAHKRAEIAGCSKCIDNCPTGALAPNGDFVSVDAMICAGCGGCASLCPSGAISYDAPDGAFTFRRIEAMAAAWRAAGGAPGPRLLVHDNEHGGEMISLAARHAHGLPADVVPLAVPALAGFGHAEMLAALAAGFGHVDLLLSPLSETATIEREQALACAVSGEDTIRLLDLADPEELARVLRDSAGAENPAATPILAMGSRRQVARLAAQALLGKPEAPVPLPEAAPYGTVHVDTDACTLCLACASLCPTGALGDNPDAPQLRFQEDACLQCGLCTRACPENALRLEARLNLGDDALSQRVLNEEEPFACIECGALFGVRATIEKITEKLAGKHEMFATSETARLIQMCDDCRVRAQYHSTDNPLQGGARARVVTTEDYFSRRKDH